MSKKNKIILMLLLMKWPLGLSIISYLIKKNLKHCVNIGFIPDFKYLCGNIYAINAYLCDTVFLDYAPIYIEEGAKFSFDNTVITSTHNLKKFDEVIAKLVYIGKNVWITSRCIILPGVKIGENYVIGTGSIVTKDIPANCFAAGNPEKVIKFFE